MSTISSVRGMLAPMLTAGALLGSAAGIGAYTFVYANGASYLSNDPEVCGNCHIMRDHVSAWLKGSHGDAATCNDCHTPPGVVAKYVNKAANGFRHSLSFTTGDHPDPLHIAEGNSRVTDRACRSCHERMIAALGPDPHAGDGDGGAMACVRCHARVGHWVH
jgi:cytochrome c nitrite reductase small subunit